MTASTVTYLAAREHINDLLREADRDRDAAKAAAPRPVRRWVANPFARRLPQPETA
ncbi:MAG TPA: hypothetical protein VEF89_06205 [Solirubrobacteraceae bacterium]|nr:hypothetical protein [Solirubrobacteraceae bacterium]